MPEQFNPFGTGAAESQFGDWEQQAAEEASFDATGGVVSSVQPYFLQPNQLAYLKNADLDEHGVRRKRYGTSSIGGGATEPLGIGTWVDGDLVRRMLGVWGNCVYGSVGDGNWTWHSAISAAPNTLYDIQQGQWTEYHGSGPQSGVSIVHSGVFLCGVNPWTGVTQPHLWMLAEDADATMQASYSPRAISWWQGRLWMANLSEPDFTPNTLLWSAILDGGDISNNNTIEIEASEGDEIMALIPSRGTAPRLYVFKRSSVYALDVVWSGGVYIPSTENSLDTTNSRVVLISEKVGCVAPKTIVYSSGSGKSDIFFLARDGFRSIQRVEQDVAGGAGEAISEPVRDVIERISWDSVHVAVASVWDHKVYLSIPVDGSSFNNLTLIFDLVKKIWVGEYDWAVEDSTAFDFTDEQEKLYLQWHYVTTETVPTSGATGLNHVFWALDSRTHYDPSYAAVDYEEQSRAMLFGDFGLKKRWSWVELMLEPQATTATLTVYGKVDDLEWAVIGQKSIGPTFEYPILPAQLPFNFEQKRAQLERLSLIDFPTGQRIQFKIETDSPSAFGTRVLRASAWPFVEQWE
jgi:hypothetical protein